MFLNLSGQFFLLGKRNRENEALFVDLIHLRMRCLISGNIFINILENLALPITSDFVSYWSLP